MLMNVGIFSSADKGAKPHFADSPSVTGTPPPAATPTPTTAVDPLLLPSSEDAAAEYRSPFR
jgi:hypothetical protein